MSGRVPRTSAAALRVLPFLCVLPLLFGSFPGNFVTGGNYRQSSAPSRVALYAEAGSPAPSPPPESVALVKVDKESMETTAGVLGGIAGLLVGGVWVGAALFAATSYLAKKEDSDISTGLKGVSKGVLEGLNFGNYVNGKYSVTDKVGGALGEALDKNLKPEQKKDLDGFVGSVTTAVDSFDKDVGIKSTLGSVAVQASDLASQAVSAAIDFNEKNKVTDKLAEKIQELTKEKPKGPAA